MLRTSLLLTGVVAGLAWAQGDPARGGWYVSGEGAPGFEVTSLEQGACGAQSASVRSRPGVPKGAVAVMQTFLATSYRGARLRYSATIDARDVKGWAGLYFRAEGANKQPLSLDDMRSRPVRGTWSCVRLEVVVDVPEEAERLSLGLVMEGAGTLELSEVALDHVPREVALTEGPANTHGRLQNVWFTEALLTTNGGANLGGRLERKAPGVWGSPADDIEAHLEGDTVVARYFQAEGPLMLSGRFKVKHADGTTTITGEWGTLTARKPVLIVYDDVELDMKWGFYERHLKVEPATQLQAGCRFYAQRASATQYSDVLEVCGGVLSPTPPPVQTVMAFVVQGFRRRGQGLALPNMAKPGVLPAALPPGQ